MARVRITRQRCHGCGGEWELGVENYNWQDCPFCGCPSASTWVACITDVVEIPDDNSDHSSSSVGSGNIVSSSSSSSSSGDGGCFLIMLGVVALMLASFIVFYPGFLLMMLFKWGTPYESVWVFWLCGIALSVLAYFLCGADWKKYTILVGGLIVITLLLSLMIDSFAPFSYVWNNMFPSKY